MEAILILFLGNDQRWLRKRTTFTIFICFVDYVDKARGDVLLGLALSGANSAFFFWCLAKSLQTAHQISNHPTPKKRYPHSLHFTFLFFILFSKSL